MRARKSLYLLLGSMVAALCLLRVTTRPTTNDAASGACALKLTAAALPVRGSLARLAADRRHSQGNELAHRLNRVDIALRRPAALPVRGSYAGLAADPRHAAGNDWVARLLESLPSSNEETTFSPRRAERLRQPVGGWIGWSGCSPYAAGRDHLGRPVQTSARASLSFRRLSDSHWASVPVVTPARARAARQ